MVIRLVRSRMVRDALEMAALSMLARKVVKEYVERREERQWGSQVGKYTSWAPNITIQDKKEYYLILAELAGVRVDDIEVNVAGNNLILEGKRQPSSETDVSGSDISEIRFGRFSRTLALPVDAGKDNIEAFLDGGILEIHVPRLRSEVPIGKVQVTVK
jgi:HSP20 family molecular chaperone IbpA